MKITNEGINVTVDPRRVCSLRKPGPDDGVIIFRYPTNKEQNEYEGNKFIQRGKKGMKNNTFNARVILAQQCVTEIKNFENEKGPIQVKDVGLIPSKILSDAYFTAFEDDDPETGDDIKNL